MVGQPVSFGDVVTALALLAGLTVLLTGEVPAGTLAFWAVVAGVAGSAGSVAVLARPAALRRLAALVAIVAALLPVGMAIPWPAPVLIALGVFGVLAWRAPDLRPEGGLPRGRPELALGGAIAAGTAVVLLVWKQLAQPDLSDAAAVYLPEGVSAPLLALGFLLFSMANAAAEELLYRGLLQPMLRTLLRSTPWAVVLQAVVFGLNHWNGIPRGPSGIALAGFYGLVLGALRVRSGGLLAPWLAHVAADLVIAALLYGFASG